MHAYLLTPASATTFASAFAASAVEAVEAFTIVLAVAVVRGWRPAVLGAAAALALLATVIAALGPLIARAPVPLLQFVIGLLLLVFGLGWLRKAVLRAGGRLTPHDESRAFDNEVVQLRGAPSHSRGAGDWLGALAAFNAVLLEGTEVTFIVLAVGAGPGRLWPAAAGAAGACALVVAAGVAVRRPLTRIPENAVKFLVGGFLTGFGVYWCAEGLGAPFPGGDWAILVLIGVYLAAGGGFAWAVHRNRPAAA